MDDMDGGRDVAIEVAAYFREVREELIDELLDAYDRTYTYSKGYTMPRETRRDWASTMVDGTIHELEGHTDPHLFETCGGDMVINVEKSITPIVTFLEARMFFARVASAFIWRRWVADTGMIRRAVDTLEKSIGDSIKANTDVFVGQIRTPGVLSATLSLNTPSGPWEGKPEVARAAVPDPSVAEPDLTAREREVLELIVAGCANKEIASQLGMTLNTAKKHVGRLFDKFGVQSRTELVKHILTR